MSGFDPVFDPAGSGSRDGSVPHPGAIEGRTYFLRADGAWAAPGSYAPGPEPPAPGPDLDAWACNIAGYLTYEVSRLAVKYAVDWLPVSWIGDVAGGIVAGIAGVLLPASLLVDGVIAGAIFTWVSTYVSGHLVDIGTALLDDVAWAKVHCALYDKIKLTPTDLHAAILAFTAILGGLVGWTTPAIAAITYLFEHLGIADVGNIPITAFARQYNCSSCAITGVGPTKPILQTAFDLTITDGTNKEPFTDTVDFVGATVAGVGSTATVTPNNATSSAVGVSRPDNTTLAVSAGVLSVLNGQLATINLAQLGAVAATASSGVTISGLVVGKTYALQNTGPPYSYDNAGDTALSFDVSVDGSTWQEVLDYGVTGFLTGPTVTKPSWAISAGMTDSQHARVVWVATATSVRFRASATDYTQASLTLGWQLLNVEFEGSSILVEHGGTKVATRPVLDIVDSATVTATITDDATNDRVMVSLAATASGGGTVGSVTSVSGTAPVAVATGTTTPVISVGVFDGHGGSHPTGLVPDPGGAGATTTFLRADGTYATPPGTGGGGTVTAVTASAPVASSGGTTPNLTLTTPLATQYGGTGLDTSAVGEGDVLVGTSSHTWVRGGIGGGPGISVTELAGIFTIAATGTGAGGTGLSLLATTRVTTVGGVSSILFSLGTPAYSHYRVIVEGRGTAAATSVFAQMQFNSDTAAHYDYQQNAATGTGTSNGQVLAGTFSRVGILSGANSPAAVASSFELVLVNPGGTDWQKSFTSTGSHKQDTGATDQYAYVIAGWWRSTAAITDILLSLNSGNFAVGTTVWVYGMA